jgi:nucleoid DNA-binding protein
MKLIKSNSSKCMAKARLRSIPGVGKNDLIRKISDATGETTHTVRSVFDALFETIIKELSSGKKIQLNGLCTWYVKTFPPKTGRNPKTGEGNIPIPERQKVRWKAGRMFKDATGDPTIH